MAQQTPEELQNQIRDLKKRLRVRVDMVDGDIHLLSPTDALPMRDAQDIDVLTKFDQWRAFRRWYLMNVKMLYESSAGAGREEAYIMCRLAKCLVDMLQDAERIKPEVEREERSDVFDETFPNPALPPISGGSLPLPEPDDD